jgi:hypothetical protein
MEKDWISTTERRALGVPKAATNQMYRRQRQEKKAYGGIPLQISLVHVPWTAAFPKRITLED